MNSIPWGNVITILVLGFLFIVSSWYISKKVSSADDYISGKGTLGVAFGTTSLLAFWVTGNTIMAAPEAAYGMGITGAIGYSVLGGVAVIAFSPLARRVHEIIPFGRTIGDFYINRFDKKNYIFFLSFILIYSFGFLMTQGIGGGLLLEQIFDIPYELSVTLTFFIVIIYATMGGFASVTGIAFFQVMLILVVVCIVPPLVYLQTGVAPIYEGIKISSPSSLNLLYPQGILFLLAGTMLGIGQVFMDNTFWQRAYAIRKNQIFKIFSLAGIGWFFVPLAVASLSFVALGTNRAPEQINQVAPFVAQIYGGQSISWIFLVGVWAALASTIAALINAIVSLITNDIYSKLKPNADGKEKLKFAKMASISVGAIALIFSLPQFLSMLQMLIFLGVINASFVFPIIFGLFWKKLNSNVSFLASVLAIIGGYFVYFTVGDLQGVVTSGWISFLVCFIGGMTTYKRFSWNKLYNVGKFEKGEK